MQMTVLQTLYANQMAEKRSKQKEERQEEVLVFSHEDEVSLLQQVMEENERLDGD